jgi:hypothetical protein
MERSVGFAQPAQCGIGFGVDARQAELRVDGDDSVGSGQYRVEIGFGHLGQVHIPSQAVRPVALATSIRRPPGGQGQGPWSPDKGGPSAPSGGTVLPQGPVTAEMARAHGWE